MFFEPNFLLVYITKKIKKLVYFSENNLNKMQNDFFKDFILKKKISYSIMNIKFTIKVLKFTQVLKFSKTLITRPLYFVPNKTP